MNAQSPRCIRPDRLSALLGSFSTVYAEAEANAAAFFDELYAAAPELRRAFGSDPGALRDRLCAMINLAMVGFERPETTISIARDIGQENARLGVLPEHYDLIGRTLIRTLDQTLGRHAFGAFVRESWIAAYETLAVTMVLTAHHDYLDRAARAAMTEDA